MAPRQEPPRALEAAPEPTPPRAPSPDLPGEDSPLLMDREHEYGDDVEEQDEWQDESIVKQGVLDMEAMRTMMTPKILAAAYFSVLLLIFGSGLESQASQNLMPYATSEFSEHALVTTVGISTSLIAGVARIPVAKLIDIWGRGEGYTLMVASATLGLILMAACKNIATYVVAQVFYAVGTDSAQYILHVFMADTSSLRNRALAFAFATTPYLLTTFAGPAVAQWFQDNSTWRWAYIAFAITTPLLASPLGGILFWAKLKAIKEGLIRRNRLRHKQPLAKQLKKLAIEFDAVGAVFFVLGLGLILIPLSLRSHYAGGYLSPTMLSQFLAGHASLCLFIVWEVRYAAVPLIPYRVVADRTVMGSCLLCFASFIAFWSYHAYFPSFLQVVHRLSISQAGYIANIFSITACLCGVSAAWLIRATGRFKPFGVFLAQPLRALGLFAMIPAVAGGVRTPTWALVACQFSVAIAGAVLVATNNAAVNAAVAHRDIAIVIAVLLLFSSVGSSVGTAVAGAVWSDSMPRLLEEFLPAGKKHLAREIYGSLKRQLEYADGTPEREAIVRAYVATETRLCVYAAVSVPFVIACVLMWRDLPVRDDVGGGPDKWKGNAPVEHED